LFIFITKALKGAQKYKLQKELVRHIKPIRKARIYAQLQVIRKSQVPTQILLQWDELRIQQLGNLRGAMKDLFPLTSVNVVELGLSM
jgi:hypothetical protein